MRIQHILLAATGIAVAVAGVGLAAGDVAPDIAAAIKARQSHMALNNYNLGILGRMAQGKLEFNAAAAQAAADNLVALARMNEMSYWPMGSSSADVQGTRALPSIWTPDSKVMDKVEGLIAATMAMQSSAGTLDGVRANMRAVGGACTACHKAHRQPKN